MPSLFILPSLKPTVLEALTVTPQHTSLNNAVFSEGRLVRLEVKDQPEHGHPLGIPGPWVPKMEVSFYLKRAHTRPKKALGQPKIESFQHLL